MWFEPQNIRQKTERFELCRSSGPDTVLCILLPSNFELWGGNLTRDLEIYIYTSNVVSWWAACHTESVNTTRSTIPSKKSPSATTKLTGALPETYFFGIWKRVKAAVALSAPGFRYFFPQLALVFFCPINRFMLFIFRASWHPPALDA